MKKKIVVFTTYGTETVVLDGKKSFVKGLKNKTTTRKDFVENAIAGCKRIRRYSGATNETVAAHTGILLGLSQMIYPQFAHENSFKKLLISHDFHEALIGDLISPIKDLIDKDFSLIEDALWFSIASDVYGITKEDFDIFLPIITTLDKAIRQIEISLLINPEVSYSLTEVEFQFEIVALNLLTNKNKK